MLPPPPPVTRTRQKRPFEELQPTQRRVRVKLGHQALERIGVPLSALVRSQSAPAVLLDTGRSQRNAIRALSGVSIPSERSLRSLKQTLAETHGTHTATFIDGAYVTDPLRLIVHVLPANTPFAIGGDAGGGSTKLGLTFHDGKRQRFLPLVVYYEADKYALLNLLRAAPRLTPFDGDSHAYSDIFSVFQHLIDSHPALAYINGDWAFLNALLALMSASAMYPCPICIVCRGHLLSPARYREPTDRLSRLSGARPLLSIPSDRILPLPLHIFLGLGNRIITEAYPRLYGRECVESQIKTVETIHSAGSGGSFDLHQLNGQEIRKWIKRKNSATLLTKAGRVSSAVSMSHKKLTTWLEELSQQLLHTRIWNHQDLSGWRTIVDQMQQNWEKETGTPPFPKLHMLRHSLEFAERHRFLGRLAESPIESFHHTFNNLFNKRHFNQAHNTAERLRRCLADTVVAAVQPSLQTRPPPAPGPARANSQ